MKSDYGIKKIIKNFSVGFISQLIILVFGLIVPRVILTHYGSDTNGLLNTISQIFAYMALLEAGIGQAATNALYKPIKDNDQKRINEIYFSARYRFRKISIIYAFAVIAIAFVLPLCLKTSVSYFTIVLIILFEGFTNVVTFYFVNTKICVLNSSGKNYIVSWYNLIARILCYFIKILLAFCEVNIAIIQFGYFVVSLLKVLMFYFYFKKHFPFVEKINQKRYLEIPGTKHYFVSEISSVIFSSTDMIVLSVCVSTTMSSVYSVYNLVFVSLSTLLNSVFTSIVYILNQAYLDDIEKYKKVHDLFNSFFIGCMTIMVCVAYFLIIPFVRLYTSGITDNGDYINDYYPILFCLIQLISWFRYVPNNLSGISGNAKRNAIYSLIEAAVNVILSFSLVFGLGIIGVLLATLIALPIRVFLLNYLSEKKILHRSPFKTITIFVVNLLIFFITILISHFNGELVIRNWGFFILYGFILVLAYTPVVFLVNFLINKDMFTIIRLFRANKKRL